MANPFALLDSDDDGAVDDGENIQSDTDSNENSPGSTASREEILGGAGEDCKNNSGIGKSVGETGHQARDVGESLSVAEEGFEEFENEEDSDNDEIGYSSEEIEAISPAGIATFQDLIGRPTFLGGTVAECIASGVEKWFSEKSGASVPKPTQIQKKCWETMFSEDDIARQSDVVVISETGSGKTAAFAVPILADLVVESETSSNLCCPKVLIVSPTRELAKQTFDTIDGLLSACNLPFSAASAYGGENFSSQIKRFESDRSLIVVGTPGRLIGLVKHEVDVLSLSRISTLVLDEVDRLLDPGFHDEMKDLASLIISNRKNITDDPACDFRLLLASATWSEETATALDLIFPSSHSRSFISTTNAINFVSKSVTQQVEVVNRKASLRFKRLMELLDSILINSDSLVIVFVTFKMEAKNLQRTVEAHGINCEVIEGNMSQTKRIGALQRFRDAADGIAEEHEAARVLITTDVSSRGIDILEVTHVVNYSLGMSIESYIHRCGRAGRAGRYGTAYTFVQKGRDNPIVPELIRVLEYAGQQIPVDLRIMGEKEAKRRQQKLVGKKEQTNLRSSSADKPLSLEDEARVLNRQRQLETAKSRKAKAHAQSRHKRDRRRKH